MLINRDVDYRALGDWLRSRLQPPAWSQWSAGNRPADPARPARTPWAARV
ncbi:MAG TPA: hypothetical protein VG268_20310 [Streptosporangiaceae bacterium]|nr:hypothetical protein [Streptosporangiaceae bacterium]